MTDIYIKRGGSEASSGLIRDRSPATVDFDNLIRRKLRVSDPNNQEEIAEALGKLYVTKKREMDAEASGLPFMTVSLPSERAEQFVSSTVELDQAKSDVERDLTALVNNSLLKDIQPELSGWASAIHTAIADGINAARFSLDPRQRDKTFAVRRMLGDYARISRYVGAMTPTMSLPYRRLSQSLDEISAVLLIMVGEALANIGFSGGNFILQIPLSELQERRDAVIYALQNLNGTKQHSGGNTVWPRGLVAYRQFIEKLSRNAHHDIRALLQENELARTMDDLIDRASGTTALGLRALGATAQPTLERFRRLIRLGQKAADPKSPPFTAFLEALGLFLAAFENSRSGYRILAISRPYAVYYGLYGIGAPDEATQRLQRLIIERGRLAELLDCYLGCECDCDKVFCQIILDKILYDVDRAIDLYALGTEDPGEPEKRAAAYGYIIDVFLTNYDYCVPRKSRSHTGFVEILKTIRNSLFFSGNDKDKKMMRDELCMQYESELNWFGLLKTMAPSCIKFIHSQTESCSGLGATNGLPTCDVINSAMDVLGGDVDECPIKPFLPRDLEDSTDDIEKKSSASIKKVNIDISPKMIEFDNEFKKQIMLSNIGETTIGPIFLLIVQHWNENFTTPQWEKRPGFKISKIGGFDVTRNPHLNAKTENIRKENENTLIQFLQMAHQQNLRIIPVLAPNESVDMEIEFDPSGEAGDYIAVLTAFSCAYSTLDRYLPVTFCSAASKLVGHYEKDENDIMIEGRLVPKGKIAQDQQVRVLDSRGEEIASTSTDKEGYFKIPFPFYKNEQLFKRNPELKIFAVSKTGEWEKVFRVGDIREKENFGDIEVRSQAREST